VGIGMITSGGRHHPRRDLLERRELCLTLSFFSQGIVVVRIVICVLLLKVHGLDPSSAGVFIDGFENGERGNETWGREGVVKD